MPSRVQREVRSVSHSRSQIGSTVESSRTGPVNCFKPLQLRFDAGRLGSNAGIGVFRPNHANIRSRMHCCGPFCRTGPAKHAITAEVTTLHRIGGLFPPIRHLLPRDPVSAGRFVQKTEPSRLPRTLTGVGTLLCRSFATSGRRARRRAFRFGRKRRCNKRPSPGAAQDPPLPGAATRPPSFARRSGRRNRLEADGTGRSRRRSRASWALRLALTAHLANDRSVNRLPAKSRVLRCAERGGEEEIER
jgi:hypothetical protein